VLDPAGLRRDLLVLLLGHVRDVAVGVEQDGSASSWCPGRWLRC